MALGLWLSCLADGQNARITTSPSPAVSNKPVEVTITTGDLGSEVFCYTWCKSLNGVEKNPEWTWDGVNTDKFRMNGSNGNYTFTINSIKEFYGLTDDELAGLTSLGFIAKNTYGGQTSDLLTFPPTIRCNNIQFCLSFATLFSILRDLSSHLRAI